MLKFLLRLYILAATVTLAVALHRGGMHLAVRSLGIGLALIVLVPASQFLFRLVFAAVDWWCWRRVSRAEAGQQTDLMRLGGGR